MQSGKNRCRFTFAASRPCDVARCTSPLPTLAGEAGTHWLCSLDRHCDGLKVTSAGYKWQRTVEGGSVWCRASGRAGKSGGEVEEPLCAGNGSQDPSPPTWHSKRSGVRTQEVLHTHCMGNKTFRQPPDQPWSVNLLSARIGSRPIMRTRRSTRPRYCARDHRRKRMRHRPGCWQTIAMHYAYVGLHISAFIGRSALSHTQLHCPGWTSQEN